MKYFFILLLSIIPQGEQPKFVDKIEFNSCYDKDTGDRRFRQIIYWKRQQSVIPHVCEWHMSDKVVRIYEDSQGRITVIYRGNDDRIVIVKSKRYIVTETVEDPEEKDRENFPIEARTPLCR